MEQFKDILTIEPHININYEPKSIASSMLAKVDRLMILNLKFRIPRIMNRRQSLNWIRHEKSKLV